ncbi:MAG: SCP2 sterol-binding domain-containing protein [Halopseudomonas sp.]
MIHFQFIDYAVNMRFWWLIVDKGNVDICLKDPGHEPDLYINAQLKTMTQAWLGDITFSQAIKDKKIVVSGNNQLKQSFKDWIGRGTFADYPPAETG